MNDTDIEICYLSASDTLKKYKEKKLSPVEVLSAVIKRIETVNPKINAFNYLDFDKSIELAKESEKKFSNNNDVLPLEGLPLAIKDEVNIKGQPNRNGCLLLKNNIAQKTDIDVETIVNSGAILHGRTTNPEFSLTSFCHSKLNGVTRNPWNLDMTPGGSSGGSAAALASGCAMMTTGSDIGGSIRIPAGTTAQRPTVPAVGMIRYNTTTSKFEGYDGNWIVLTGVYDLDADTYITAELTPGANDNTIRFYSNGNLIANITETEFNVAKINVDSIQIDGNTISTTTANTDLNLTPNGTGGVQIDNFNISGSTINNTSSGATSVLDPGTGFFKIQGTDAFIVPAGTGAQRHSSPVLGMTRWNTTDGRLEIYDGTVWDTVAGSSGAVSQTDAQNIALELVLSLG